MTQQDVGQSLINLIKKVDNATNIFVGEVISVDIPNRICTVKAISGVANDGIQIEPNDPQADYLNYINTPLIHDDVALMSGGNIDDGVLMIPSVGSNVTVMTTKRHQSFIIQYSGIDNFSLIPASDYTINVNKNTVILSQTSLDLKINNGAEMKLDTKIDIKAKNGAEITADTKISIKNTSDSLASIMADFCTAIETITVTCASPGSPSTVPLNVATFTSLATRFNNLLQP